MRRLIFLSALFVCILVASNFMAVKLVDIGFVMLPSAVICYPFCFMINDLINEFYGFKTSKFVVYMTFVLNAVVIFFLAISAVIPPSTAFVYDEGYRAIFLSAPRILIASFCAFVVSGLLNAYVFSKIKKAGAMLGVRSAISTFLSIVVDSALFIVGAFAFSLPISVVLMMVLWQTLAKLLFGLGLGTPLTILGVKLFKKWDETHASAQENKKDEAVEATSL